MSKSRPLLLGINIDHIATLREARGGIEPSTLQAVREAVRGGANGITVHLREDRRHIQDHDVYEIKKMCRVPLNLEMALHPEIIRIALKVKPEKVCLVPEKRRELTTEGGLDLTPKQKKLKTVIPQFHQKKIEVSLFIDPDEKQIRIAAEVGADAVEIHTGSYANARGRKKQKELLRIKRGAGLAHQLGLKVHAGHGLNYTNTRAVARIPEITELNIGHSIVSRAVFTGLWEAVSEMKNLMKHSRKS